MSYDFDCYCASNNGEQCVTCEIENRRALDNLAACLAVAGGLCEAFSLGHVRGVYRPTINDSRIIIDEYEATVWRPGCGRQAP